MAEMGGIVRELHEALATVPSPLPRLERLDQIERVIDGLRPPDAAILRAHPGCVGAGTSDELLDPYREVGEEFAERLRDLRERLIV